MSDRLWRDRTPAQAPPAPPSASPAHTARHRRRSARGANRMELRIKFLMPRGLLRPQPYDWGTLQCTKGRFGAIFWLPIHTKPSSNPGEVNSVHTALGSSKDLTLRLVFAADRNGAEKGVAPLRGCLEHIVRIRRMDLEMLVSARCSRLRFVGACRNRVGAELL